jgi:hypothetical protein
LPPAHYRSRFRYGLPGAAVKLGADGLPDIAGAYAKGIGEWDKVAIAYGYQDFRAGTDEQAALDKILSDAFRDGVCFISPIRMRGPAGASLPIAHLWDNGAERDRRADEHDESARRRT